jgi:hypothetical protein
MLARGVEATIQCAPKLAKWLTMPTIERGAALDGFAAAAPLRSLPYLLGWTLDSLPSLLVLTRRAEPSSRIGWFSQADPPTGVDIERNIDELPRCRFVVGDDAWPAHLAARLGIPTIVLLPRLADWLWGPRLGPSPWYPSVELLAADDAEALALRLNKIASP